MLGLREAPRLLNRLRWIEVAAWNRPGELKLYLGSTAASDNVKHPSQKSRVVRAETLDQIVAENHLLRVDWVKVDVEDSEVEVLEGMENAMLQMKPRVIVEVWSENRQALLKIAKRVDYGAVQISPPMGSAACYWLLLPT